MAAALFFAGLPPRLVALGLVLTEHVAEADAASESPPKGATSDCRLMRRRPLLAEVVAAPAALLPRLCVLLDSQRSILLLLVWVGAMVAA